MKEGSYDILLKDMAISDTSAKSYDADIVTALLTITDPSAIGTIESKQSHGKEYDLQGRQADRADCQGCHHTRREEICQEIRRCGLQTARRVIDALKEIVTDTYTEQQP